MKKSLETPITNRGVEKPLNTDKTLINKGYFNGLGQFILFDWLQFTILSDSISYFDENGEFFGYKDVKYIVSDLFKELFNIEYNDLFFEYKGINGYNSCCSYNNIYCYWHTSRVDMGIHFKLSGQGCRDFEDLGLDYISFFRKLNSYSLNFNRIDISIDDFTGSYFNLNKLLKYCKRGAVSSKFRSVLNLEKLSLSDSSNLGHTLQFGSKASNIQVTFYDKLKERQSQSFIVDENIKHWIRTEVRFRHELADSLIITILRNSNNVNYVVKAVLRDYIDFKDLSSIDSHKYRRATALFWEEFLENIDSLKLTNYLPESSFTKKAKWLNESVAKSNLIVFLGSLDNLKLDEVSSEYLLKLLKNGFDKFNYKDLIMLNEHRKLKKLEPLEYSEIKSYIEDIQEVALLSVKK